MKVDQLPTFRLIPLLKFEKNPNSPPLKKVFFPGSCLFLFVDSFCITLCITLILPKFEKRQTDQLKTFQKFLSNHGLQYLVQAMLCAAVNTSPVERGYTILQMVRSKRRN